MTGGKRPPTHVGPRGEIRTPGRGVPTETLPPPNRDFDFESGTPPAMDPSTYRAIKKLRGEMLAADKVHGKRLDQVETGLTNMATAATALSGRMNGVEVSHASMAGEFRVLHNTLIQDRDDARLEAKAKADHRRKLIQSVVAGLFSTGVLVAIITAIARCS